MVNLIIHNSLFPSPYPYPTQVVLKYYPSICKPFGLGYTLGRTWLHLGYTLGKTWVRLGLGMGIKATVASTMYDMTRVQTAPLGSKDNGRWSHRPTT